MLATEAGFMHRRTGNTWITKELKQSGGIKDNRSYNNINNYTSNCKSTFFEFPTQDLRSEYSVTMHKDDGPTNATIQLREATWTNTRKADDALFLTNGNTCHVQDELVMS